MKGVRMTELLASEERFVHQTKLFTNQGIFNERIGITVKGKLQMSVLIKSLNEVVNRHEILRSFVIEENSKTKLVILPELSVYITEETYQDDDALLAKVTEVASKPFDLSKAPLFRVHCFHQSEDSHLLVLAMHHMISDGEPSFRIFLKEILYFYNRIEAREDLDVTIAAPLRRSQTIAASIDLLFKSKNMEDLNFWKSYLKNSIPTLDLSMKSSFSTSFQSNMLKKPIDFINLSNLQEHKIFFLSSFFTLLTRYTNQKDISIGLPFFNRGKLPGLQETLGYYGGVVVLKQKIPGNSSFSEFLKSVQENYYNIMDHKGLPFQEVVQEICPQWRNSSRSPLFSVLFVFLPDNETYHHKKTTFSTVDINLGLIPYDMIFTVRFDEISGNTSIILEYNSSIYEEDFMASLLEKYEILIQAFSQDSNIGIYDVPLCRDNEFEDLVVKFNQTSTPYPYDKSIIEVFDNIAKNFPHKIAVMDSNNVAHTYEHLNKDSIILAQNILKLIEILPNISIGVTLPRSYETICSFLAILRVGCPYLPIDTAFPDSRIHQFLDASKAQLIIANKEDKTRFSTICPNIKLIAYEEILGAYGSACGQNCTVSSENLAYIMFTSGKSFLQILQCLRSMGPVGNYSHFIWIVTRT